MATMNGEGGAGPPTSPGGAMAVEKSTFFERTKKILKHFTKQKSHWGEADALVFVFGAPDDSSYNKSMALQYHLFGKELHNAILTMVPSGVHILADEEVCKGLGELTGNESGDVKVTLHERDAADGDKAGVETLLGLVKGTAGGNGATENGETKKVKMGVLVKETAKGQLAERWAAAVPKDEIQEVDVTSPLAHILAVKDEAAAKNMDTAAKITSKIFKKAFIQRIEDIIDEDVTMKHDALAEEVEGVIKDPMKIELKVPKEQVESCYFPIVESGGVYDIKASAMSNSNNLKHDIIICSMGASYKGYCANLARTILVDPPKKVQDAYRALTGAYEACLNAMRPGETLKSVYEACRAHLDKKYPAYLQHLPKSLGSSIGVEFRDPQLVINAKANAIIKPRMFFNLAVGFHNIPLTPQERKQGAKKGAPATQLETFSLLIADTVKVPETPNAAPDEKLVTKYEYQLGKVMWEIGDDDENADDEEDADGDEQRDSGRDHRRGAETNILGSRLRDRKRDDGKDGLTQGEIDKQMRGLLGRKMQERAAKSQSTGKKKDQDDEGAIEELKTYRTSEQYPKDMRPHQIFVDMEREAVILPIHGMHVPFHISTIKNVVQPEADAAAYLRINFYTPGQSIGKDAPTVITKLLQVHGQKCGYIKEMLFRSLDHRNLSTAFRLIQELRKRARQRERIEKEEADLVEQEKLVLTKNQKIPRLADVVMRPHISGRKTVGNLEAHTNGLRFKSKKGEIVDVMYNNIRNAIFQPCFRETNVIIHFHLKDPIMINKKKTQEVQFFTEVVESMIDMEGTRRSTYDPDEIEEEQREREVKRRLNEVFKDFCQKVQAVAQTNDYSLDFDAPYKDLSFFGTPHREMVTVHFSAQCILSVSEMPFFVAPLDDIEHVHFERVTPSSKNFDMVIILKNLEKEPFIINSIPREYFVQIERTLLDVEITFTYGPSSFRWKEVFAQMGRGEENFYADVDGDGEKKPAGWEFLLPSEVVTDESGSEDDADSEFEAQSSEEEEEEEEDDESEYEEDAESGSEYVDEEDEEDYEEADWDRQERRLVAEDKVKRQNEEEVDPRKAGARGPPPRGRGPPPKRARR